jgi:hypothetical protein
MDVASLSFSIDSGPAERAITSLDRLRSSADSMGRSSAQLNQQFSQGVRSLTDYQRATLLLGETASKTAKSLDDLVGKMDTLTRGSVFSGGSGMMELQKQLESMSRLYGQSAASAENFVRATRAIGLSAGETSTALQRITLALENVTAEGRQARSVLEQYGVTLNGLGLRDAESVLRNFTSSVRGSRDSLQRTRDIQMVFGPLSSESADALSRQRFLTEDQRRRDLESNDASRRAAAARELASGGASLAERNRASLEALRSDFGMQGPDLGRMFRFGQSERDVLLSRRNQYEAFRRGEGPAPDGLLNIYANQATDRMFGGIRRWYDNFATGGFAARQGVAGAASDFFSGDVGPITGAYAYASITARNLLNMGPSDYEGRLQRAIEENRLPESARDRQMRRLSQAQSLQLMGDTGMAGLVAAESANEELVRNYIPTATGAGIALPDAQRRFNRIYGSNAFRGSVAADPSIGFDYQARLQGGNLDSVGAFQRRLFAAQYAQSLGISPSDFDLGGENLFTQGESDVFGRLFASQTSAPILRQSNTQRRLSENVGGAVRGGFNRGERGAAIEDLQTSELAYQQVLEQTGDRVRALAVAENELAQARDRRRTAAVATIAQMKDEAEAAETLARALGGFPGSQADVARGYRAQLGIETRRRFEANPLEGTEDEIRQRLARRDTGQFLIQGQGRISDLRGQAEISRALLAAVPRGSLAVEDAQRNASIDREEAQGLARARAAGDVEAEQAIRSYIASLREQSQATAEAGRAVATLTSQMRVLASIETSNELAGMNQGQQQREQFVLNQARGRAGLENATPSTVPPEVRAELEALYEAQRRPGNRVAIDNARQREALARAGVAPTGAGAAAARARVARQFAIGTQGEDPAVADANYRAALSEIGSGVAGSGVQGIFQTEQDTLARARRTNALLTRGRAGAAIEGIDAQVAQRIALGGAAAGQGPALRGALLGNLVESERGGMAERTAGLREELENRRALTEAEKQGAAAVEDLARAQQVAREAAVLRAAAEATGNAQIRQTVEALIAEYTRLGNENARAGRSQGAVREERAENNELEVLQFQRANQYRYSRSGLAGEVGALRARQRSENAGRTPEETAASEGRARQIETAREELRLTQEIRDSYLQVGQAISQSAEIAIIRGRNARDIWQGLGETIQQIILRSTFTKPLERGIESITGAGFDFISRQFSGGSGSSGGGIFQSIASAALSLFGSAEGNAFASGRMIRIHPFEKGGLPTNSVIREPMTFDIGAAGEGGKPEAVMPLVRMPSGMLGVRAGGGGGGIVVAPTINVTAPAGQSDAMNERQSQTMGREIAKSMKSLVLDVMREEGRPGGMLYDNGARR